MPELSRLEKRILHDFPAPGSAHGIITALDRLPEEAGYGEEHLRSERVRAAIVLLADGSLSGFRRAVELAKTDWRDLLVAAELANEDWPARLDEALGPEDAGRPAVQEGQTVGIVTVPDPESDWGDALHPGFVSRNPAQQYFTFEEAMGRYRELAGLKVNITDIARRLRLMLEPGHRDQLGPVDAAFFSIRRTGFAIHRYGTEDYTLLGVYRAHEIDPVEAVDVFLEALGVDWRAVATIAFGEGPDLRHVEPILDARLRPAFPAATGNAGRPGS